MKFNNLKLGSKFSIGFGFFILFLMVASITEFFSLKGIEKNNKTAIKSHDLAGAFLESKNHALRDNQILKEIMESNTNEQLTNWINMHATTRSDFESIIAKARETAGNTGLGK